MPKKKARSAQTTPPRRRARPGGRKVAQAISTRRPGEDGSSKGMLLGYARVSTIDHTLGLQRDALAEAGCGKIFTDPAMDPATFDHSGHCPVSGRQKWDAVYQSECPADIIRIRRQGIASVGLGIGGRAELSPNQMGRCPQLFCDE